jgi:hypothetical protein
LREVELSVETSANVALSSIARVFLGRNRLSGVISHPPTTSGTSRRHPPHGQGGAFLILLHLPVVQPGDTRSVDVNQLATEDVASSNALEVFKNGQ